MARPYEAVGAMLGASGEQGARSAWRSMLEGLIRRIGAVPNHYRLGYTANGMSVWDVADDQIAELGPRVADLPGVGTATAAHATCPAGPTTCLPCCTAPAAPPSSSRPRRSCPAGPRLPQPRHPVFHGHPEKTGLRLKD